MGCDIHLHTEVKINGVWHHLGMPNISRNYAMFAKMANVRNNARDIVPISKPRGLPENITFITMLDAQRWGTDGHSYSWLTPDEIYLLEDFMVLERKKYSNEYWYIEKDIGYLFSDDWRTTRADLGIEDARIVFWFDN